MASAAKGRPKLWRLGIPKSLRDVSTARRGRCASPCRARAVAACRGMQTAAHRGPRAGGPQAAASAGGAAGHRPLRATSARGLHGLAPPPCRPLRLRQPNTTPPLIRPPPPPRRPRRCQPGRPSPFPSRGPSSGQVTAAAPPHPPTAARRPLRRQRAGGDS